MKKETYQNKLLEMLAKANPHAAKKLEKAKELTEQRKGKIQGIPEEEIQNFRSLQGVLYFLQAPELFSYRECKREGCDLEFLVSRKFVAYCSYSCIRKSLNSIGLDWDKGNDVELLVKDVYEGNEPIWIHDLEQLERVLTHLKESRSTSQVGSEVLA